jgi:transketolase
MNKLETTNKLRKRLIDISYKHKLSHIGSCLTTLPIIVDIYSEMDLKTDKFVLSSGHAGLALYVVLEHLGYGDAEIMLRAGGIHPDRSINNVLAIEYGTKSDPIHCSTGSLGQGLPIALGMALADESRDVYCVVSDGECSEGSIWEALKIASDYNVLNLRVHFNINGSGAYSLIDSDILVDRLEAFSSFLRVHLTDNLLEPHSALNGIDAHYHVLTEDEYHTTIEEITKLEAIL